MVSGWQFMTHQWHLACMQQQLAEQSLSHPIHTFQPDTIWFHGPPVLGGGITRM